MSLKFVFLLISTLVLLQSALCYSNTEETVMEANNTFSAHFYPSTNETEVETNNTSTDLLNSKRKILFDSTSSALLTKMYSYLGRVKNILTDITQKYWNALKKEALDDFNKYMHLIEKKASEEILKCTMDLETKYNLRQEVLQMLAKYDSHEIDGFPQLKTDFATELGTFFKDFEKRSDEFWNCLSAEEKAAESKFKDWREQFVAEKDLEKKLHMILDLFEMYKFKYAACI